MIAHKYYYYVINFSMFVHNVCLFAPIVVCMTDMLFNWLVQIDSQCADPQQMYVVSIK